MEFKLVSPREPLDITVAGETIRIYIDTTPAGQLEIVKASASAAKKMAPIEKLLEDAINQGDEPAEMRARAKTAQVVKDCLVPIIGEESYEAIMNAATGGDPEFRDRTIGTFTQLLYGITALVKEQNEATDQLNEASASPLPAEDDPDSKVQVKLQEFEAAKAAYLTAMRDLQEVEGAHPNADEPLV